MLSRREVSECGKAKSVFSDRVANLFPDLDAGKFRREGQAGEEAGRLEGTSEFVTHQVNRKKNEGIVYFSLMCISINRMCVYAHVCAWGRGLQSHKRALDPLALE